MPGLLHRTAADATTPPPSFLLRSTRLPWRLALLGWAALQRYLDAGGMRQGAAVSFYAAFSIAPLLVVVTGVMVWLMGDAAAQAALLDTLRQLIGEQETRTVADLLARRQVAPSDGEVIASWVALGSTLIGATGVFIELRAALQAMLGDDEPKFSWWQLVRVRLLAIGIALGCGFLLSVAMLLQAVSLLALRWVSSHMPWATAGLVALEGVWSWAVISVIFALLIRWLPSGHVRLRDALVGAAVAAALFMVGRYGISLYIATTATRSALGAAGSFAALLVWLYWSSQIFLIGAAISIELGMRHERTIERDVPDPEPGPA